MTGVELVFGFWPTLALTRWVDKRHLESVTEHNTSTTMVKSTRPIWSEQLEYFSYLGMNYHENYLEWQPPDWETMCVYGCVVADENRISREWCRMFVWTTRKPSIETLFRDSHRERGQYRRPSISGINKHLCMARRWVYPGHVCVYVRCVELVGIGCVPTHEKSSMVKLISRWKSNK